MSTTVGVIVCNHSRARLFKADAHSLTQELSDQVNPAARLRDQDLATDAPGRYRGGGTNGQQHTEDPRTAPREKAAEHFARDIAAAIEQAIAEHKLQKLYLIAEPNMLGLVRKALPEHYRQLVAKEIAKDIVARPPAEIRDFLPVPL